MARARGKPPQATSPIAAPAPAPAPTAAPAPPAPGTSRRQWRFVLLGVAVVVVAVLGWRWWDWYLAPAPPAVTLTDADPAVAAAIESARKDVWWHPHSAAAWGKFGQLLRAHGYIPESNRCFAEAERLDPDDPRWPYLQGTGVQSDDPEAAAQHLERAVSLCGVVPDAPQLLLAEVHLQLGQVEEADRNFRKVLRGDPGNARAHLGLGRVARERGHPRDAIAHLERSASSRLTQQASRALLAQAYQQLGDAAAAARERALAVELPSDPPWPDPFREEVQNLMIGKQARLARLQTLERQGRVAEWREQVEQVEKAYPDVYWLVEGRQQMSQRNFPAAERALRRSIELAPSSVDAHFDLGTALFAQGSLAAAADAYRKVTELEPGYGPAHLRLGRCLDGLGDRSGALRALEAAVRLMPQQAEAHRELGALMAREGRMEEAAARLRQALRLQPDDAKAKELLDEVSRRKP